MRKFFKKYWMDIIGIVALAFVTVFALRMCVDLAAKEGTKIYKQLKL